ncbi:hypothetical protein DFJ73DRAFT_847999 [Zopfochytrium polystomum]|nr:hypothetical protein DFJ73DRAFT_847999 [Zopfochytrium polystomum]
MLLSKLRQTSNKVLMAVAYVSLFTAVIIGAALLSYFLYNTKAAGKLKSVESKTPSGNLSSFPAATDPLNSDPSLIINKNVLVVQLTPSIVDPIARSIKFKVQGVPCGDYANFAITQGQQYVVKKNIALVITDKELKYKKNTVIGTKEVTVDFATGLVNDYPFDVYESRTVYIDSMLGKDERMHLSVIVSGAMQGWIIKVTNLVDISGDFYGDNIYDGRLIALSFTVERAFIVKFFVGLVTFNMWMLSSLVTMLALTFWHRGQKDKPVPMALSVGTIFSLYGLRSSQPGVPEIGCFMDTVAYFWCTVLAAGSAVLLILQYMVRHPREAPPPEGETFWTIFFEAYLPEREPEEPPAKKID